MAIVLLFLEVLASAIGTKSSPQLSKEQVIRDQMTIDGQLLRILNGTVPLVRRSARDYLLRQEVDSNALLEQLRIKLEEVHLQIAWACLDYIGRSGLRDTPLNLKKSTHWFIRQKDSFIHYALLRWVRYTRSSLPLAGWLLEHPSSLFGEKSSLLRDWLREHTG